MTRKNWYKKMINIESDFKIIKPTYITEKDAITIANNNKTLKQAIYEEGLKHNIRYDLLIFKKFKIKLVKYYDKFAWLIKVIDGEFGYTKYRKILGKRIEYISGNGCFEENSNIYCLVMVNDGEFIYIDSNDLDKVKPINKKEYDLYLK